MIGHGPSWRMRFACAAMALAACSAQAQEYAATRAGARSSALTPVRPPVMPQTDGSGSYGLRLHFDHLESVTSNVELRRHQYFVDDNLKAQHPRTSIAWTVRWYF